MKVREGEDEKVECSHLLLEIFDVSDGGKGRHVLSGQQRYWQLSVRERREEIMYFTPSLIREMNGIINEYFTVKNEHLFHYLFYPST